MNEILLVAINAKYIHSNLAVYDLFTCAKARGISCGMAEFTINQHVDMIFEEIYRRNPGVLCFSCYIWNIEYVRELAAEYHKLRPQVPVWAGGPEVSYETEKFLRENPSVTGVMAGEGEETFCELCRLYQQSNGQRPADEELSRINGLVYRTREGELHRTPPRMPVNMDDIPFCYTQMPDVDLSHRIIYYEASRGCPFSCTYCLSSVEDHLRTRSLPLVFQELQYFLDHRVPQVKFVDRTFNCDRKRALAIWRFLLEHDNGITNFHFEVGADLITQEELDVIAQMRPGLIQLEIGVQTTNPRTIRSIKRIMDLGQVRHAVRSIQKFGNTHQHLDLIAGLPYEDLKRFAQSFDDIYAIHPNQLQLGFLKLLKGSYMYEHAADYGMIWHERPPYDIMQTRWLSYDDILLIRDVEEMLELHYNSGQFAVSIRLLEHFYDSPFRMFLEMGRYYRTHGLLHRSYNRVDRSRIFLQMALEKTGDTDQKRRLFEEGLIYDLYARENSKKRPEWAADTGSSRKWQMQYLKDHGLARKYVHMEPFHYDFCKWLMQEAACGLPEKQQTPLWMVFDYEKRDPLTGEATVRQVTEQR